MSPARVQISLHMCIDIRVIVVLVYCEIYIIRPPVTEDSYQTAPMPRLLKDTTHLQRQVFVFSTSSFSAMWRS